MTDLLWLWWLKCILLTAPFYTTICFWLLLTVEAASVWNLVSAGTTCMVVTLVLLVVAVVLLLSFSLWHEQFMLLFWNWSCPDLYLNVTCILTPLHSLTLMYTRWTCSLTYSPCAPPTCPQTTGRTHCSSFNVADLKWSLFLSKCTRTWHRVIFFIFFFTSLYFLL